MDNVSDELVNGGSEKKATQFTHDNLLSCLVFLTAHFGRAKSAEAIVAGLPYDGKIMLPQLFREAAARLYLRTGIIKKPDWKQVPSANLPCVLILNGKKACVLLKVNLSDSTAQVYMPEHNEMRMLTFAALDELYKGYCIYIKPQPEFLRGSQKGHGEGDVSVRENHSNDDDPARHWFWSIVHEGRSIYAMALLASVFINLFVLVGPLFIMNVYDRVIPNNAIETGWALGIGALAVFVFDFIIKTIRGYLIDLSGRRIDVIAGRRIYDQVLNMKLSGRPKSSGNFASMLKDFDAVREFFTSATITVLVDLPFTILFLFVIYQLAGNIAFVLLGLIVVVVVVGYILQFPLKRLIRLSVKSSEARHGLLVETIHGLETIKSIGADGRFRKFYGDYVAENAAYGQRSRFISAIGVNTSGFVQQIASIVVVLFGMYMVQSGDLTVGGLIASVILGGRAIAPVGQMASLMAKYHQAGGALKTLNGIMSLPVERPAERNYLHRPDLSGAVRFDGVSFVYPATDRKVLENVSFTIKAGEKVGIIGRVGSGKSTITKLLTGLFEPQEGTILLDNTDMRQIDPADVRRAVGYIAQDVFLFSGTVRDNIAASVPHAREEDILLAAQKSGAHEFIARHPMGYDAPVGEHGNNLSGGQKQAIALARALLMKSRILLCDEPTNAMDTQAEAAFLNLLQTDMKDATVILITHKANMLPALERLIVVDQGKIMLDGARDKVLEALKS
ncbi:MAG: type I secretion system permease/ATPase [Alphaproteobacteria bacterium]